MEIYQNESNSKPGGVIISDIIDGKRIVLLGKSNVPNRKDTYESFGGKMEETDISSLHTALRELVEEFFNTKVTTEFVNELYHECKKGRYVLKRYEYYGISYLINIDGLNKIFQKVCTINPSLNDYNDVEKSYFNYMKYIEERIINDLPSDGLNEIESIHIVELDDIKNNKINIRWYTNKVIGKMLK